MNWNIKHTHTRTKKLTKTEQKYHCHLHPRCWTLRNSIFIVIVSHSLRNVASFVVSLCVPSWMGLSSTKRRKKKTALIENIETKADKVYSMCIVYKKAVYALLIAQYQFSLMIMMIHSSQVVHNATNRTWKGTQRRKDVEELSDTHCIWMRISSMYSTACSKHMKRQLNDFLVACFFPDAV